ncbi:MAG: ferrous iron transport protein A [Abditibacteriales bacterium]|nr:ferrous iron transport protein A [Abditibacteriales bacterium]MDW8364439.1 FeoA family protein [Abditibacteriales bacterium]
MFDRTDQRKALTDVPPETLAALRPGERGVVQTLHCTGLTRRRLLDLGLVPGTEVEAVMVSPNGDPIAYQVRGTLLALRREDAASIEIRRVS